MKKLFGLLVILAIVAGVFMKADAILEAAGYPDLARQAKTLRDGLLTRITGRDGEAIEDGIAAKAKEGVEKVAQMLKSFRDSMGFDPDELAKRAVGTFESAEGMVSQDFAEYFEWLKVQGERYTGSVTDYALSFSEHYSDEIAPDLVGYWNDQIASGQLAADKLEQTKQALAKIRARMQPLLTDHLRVLTRLERRLESTKDEKVKREIEKDIEEVEADIQRSFVGVPSDDKVLDSKKAASERLAIQLRSTGQGATGTDSDEPADATAAESNSTGEPRAKDDPSAAGTDTEARVASADPKTVETKLRTGVDRWIPTSYRMGTNTRHKTTDCSGFVGGVMRDTFKLELPRTSRLQYRFGTRVKSKDDLRPGDLVFFDMKKRKRIDHVGVYVGKDDQGVQQFAHASFSSGVRYDTLVGYYKKFYWGAARVLDL